MILSCELPASLPNTCAPREDIVAAFERHAAKPYIYVQAPAGYGKTVTALLWLKRTGHAFAWLSLDRYDNTPSLFYRMLCHALLATIEPPDALTQFVNSPSFSSAPAECAMEFFLMFPWRDEKFILVLDDLHNVTSEDILRSLPYVLKKLPLTVTVLFLSRMALPDALASLTRGNAAAFIDSNDLSFTPEEIRRYFTENGQPLSKDEANGIYAQTDGWAILVNAMLASGYLSLAEGGFELSFNDFYEANIWNGLDGATQAFLMRSCVPDSFTVELCALLTDDEDCERTLDGLIRRNINLVRFGDEYRYHHLFLAFLRQRLQMSGIDQKGLSQKAAAYYLEHNEFFKAAGFSLESGDAALDMQVVTQFFRSKAPTLEQYLELAAVYDARKVSDELRAKRPILYMPNILSAFLTGDIENTKRLFDMFYAALPTFVKVKHPITDVAATRLILDYRVSLADLPGFMDGLGLERGVQAPGQAAVVTMQMPLLHRSNRDYTEFLKPGTQEAVRGLLGSLLQDDLGCFLGSVNANLLMEQNRLNEAYDLAIDAYTSMREATANEVFFGVSIGLAQIYMLRSEKALYHNVIDRLHRWIEEKKAINLLKGLLAFEERLRLWDGNQKSARDWLNRSFVDGSTFGEFSKIYLHFTTVRAFIAASMPDAALDALAQMRKLAKGMNRPLDVAEADVLAAIALWVLGKREQAESRLRCVLADLQPFGYIRVIADEGKAVLPIVAAVIKQMEKEDGKDEDLYRFTKEVHLAAHEQAKRFKGLTYDVSVTAIRLSPRQTYVLELLAKGYKNAQIVEMTGLSLNTIRSHTKIIYQKLEVTNALDAIAEAKHLGII